MSSASRAGRAPDIDRRDLDWWVDKGVQYLVFVGGISCSDASDSRAKLIELTRIGKRHMQYLSDATEGVWQQYVDELGLTTTKKVFAGLRTLLSGASSG